MRGISHIQQAQAQWTGQQQSTANWYRPAVLTAYEQRLPALRDQMQHITKASEAAAKAVVDDRAKFGVIGPIGVQMDFAQRPGAMLGYLGQAPKPGDVALTMLVGSDTEIGKHLLKLETLNETGSVIVAIGSKQHLTELGLWERVTDATPWVIDVDGLGTEASGRNSQQDQSAELAREVDRAMALTAAWTFHCEWYAACTRLGPAPVIVQSLEIDTRQKRWVRYMGQAFHDDLWIDPIEPGELGKQYLAAVDGLVLDLWTAGGDALDDARYQVASTARDGGRVLLSASPRLVFAKHHLQSPWFGSMGMLSGLGTLPGNDLVVAVGEVDPPGSLWWQEMDQIRQAERGVVWVLAGYLTDDRDLDPDEVLLDNFVPFGDCSVRIEGYDCRLGPLSSVANELLITELAWSIRQAQQSAN